MSRVSVVIPTYKRSNTILRAVRSVLDQTHRDLEIVVVDDNGAGTAEQLHTRSALGELIDDGHVTYIVQPVNGGANAARNAGVRQSSGKYVAFLDDDDEWMPQKLARQVAVMESDADIGVVYTKTVIRYADLGLEYVTRPRLRGHIHDELLIENYVGAMVSVLIRRDALLENPLDEGLPARQDYDLWLRISRKWKFEIVDEVLAVSHAKNTSSRITANINNYIEAIRIIEDKYREEIVQLPESARIRRTAEQCYFLGSQSTKANRPDLARRYFAQSLRTRFSLKALLALLSSFLGMKATVYVRALQSSLKR
jgi:glycosyltransferase involved in cell wall biosynthesis